MDSSLELLGRQHVGQDGNGQHGEHGAAEGVDKHAHRQHAEVLGKALQAQAQP